MACTRLTATYSRERLVLRSLGATNPLLGLDAFAPLLAVIVVGATVGVFGSWLASSRLPIGLARRFEPSLGLGLDITRTAAAAGSCFIGAILTAAAAAICATRPRRRRRRLTAPPARKIVPVTSAVATSIGIRGALERGSSERPAPTISSTIGAALSVTAIVAVATFGGALDRLVEHPSRYGYGWDATIRSADVAAVTADPDVAAAAPIWFTVRIRVNGRSVVGWASEPTGRDPGLVGVAGRFPEEPDEVSLGAKTMRAAGVKIGDSVDLDGHAFRVVGQALFPPTQDAFPLAEGALVSSEAMDGLEVELGDDEPWSSMVAVRLGPHVDRTAVLARLGKLGDSQEPEQVIVPREVNQLRQLRTFPVTLGALLSATALLGVGFGLSLAIRRRADDRAILRALGFTRRQVRLILAAHATTLACIAVAVGVPAGLLLGNLVWATVARSYGLSDDAVLPLRIAVLMLATIVSINMLAWGLGRRGANLAVASALYVE